MITYTKTKSRFRTISIKEIIRMHQELMKELNSIPNQSREESKPDSR